MAADNESQYPGDASGQLNPALQSVVDTMQTGPGQQWTADGANAIQDYLTKKAVVAENAQAADEVQTNMNETRRSLTQFVQTDPSPDAIDLALGLASHAVNGVVSQHQHLEDDQRSAIAAPIIADMQNEIKHAYIQKLSELDQGEAYAAIDKYAPGMPDGHPEALRAYADAQAVFRTQDAVATRRQQLKDTALQGYAAATQHLNSITDPDTNQFTAQPGFIANMMNDQTLALPTKLALHAGYNQLMQNGDTPQSNPRIVADLIARIGSDTPPQQGEILSHLGGPLSLSDASFLNGLIAPAAPQRRADLRTLADTVSQARDTLQTPANGIAGAAAFGRFVNWLTPALQRGGNLTDLMADNRIQQFAPRPVDMYNAIATSGPRPPLHMIFAGAANG